MPEDKNFQSLAKSRERHLLRAAIALGTTAILGAGVAPVAIAAPSVTPASAVVSMPANAINSDAEIEAVKQLKLSYFDNVDSKQWNALRDLLAPDVVVDTTSSLGPIFFGRDPFVAFLALTLGALNTRHKGYDPQITFTSDTTAEVTWTMQDRLVFANIIGVHGHGIYTDRYEKVDGQWVIVHSKLTRTSLGVVSPALEHFVSEFGEVWNSDGPVAAIQYAVTFAVTAPFDSINAVVGAVFSAIGGPPAKAEDFDVPSASSTLDSPTDAKLATAAATLSTNALAASAPATTGNVPAADAAPSVAVATDGTLKGADVPAENQAEPVESAATQLADDDTLSGAQITDLTGESQTMRDESLNSADARDDAEPKKTAEGRDDTEPKKTADARDETEPKKTAEGRNDTEPK